MSLTLNMSGSGGGSKAKIVLTEISTWQLLTNHSITTDYNLSFVDNNYFNKNIDNSFTCLKSGTYNIYFGGLSDASGNFKHFIFRSNDYYYSIIPNTGSISDDIYNISLEYGDVFYLTFEISPPPMQTNTISNYCFISIEREE